ncbi:hypothetical protein [Paraliobacillus zengyii]
MAAIEKKEEYVKKAKNALKIANVQSSVLDELIDYLSDRTI